MLALSLTLESAVLSSPRDKAAGPKLRHVVWWPDHQEGDHRHHQRNPAYPHTGLQPPDDRAEECSPPAGRWYPGERQYRRPHYDPPEVAESSGHHQAKAGQHTGDDPDQNCGQQDVPVEVWERTGELIWILKIELKIEILKNYRMFTTSSNRLLASLSHFYTHADCNSEKEG